MIQERAYQTDIINQARDFMRRGVKRILIQAPTGSGKTVLTAKMLGTATERGMDNFFIVHRKELVEQSSLTLDKVGIRHGIISASFQPDLSPLTQVCSIDSLRSRLEKIGKKPKLIVWDEGHHLVSQSWLKVFNYYPDAFHIIVTATPERLDGKGLKEVADVMIKGPSVSWLIENKYLADYAYYEPNSVSMAGIRKQMGEFSKAESAALIDRPSITGSAVNEYLKVASGKRCIGFAITIEHSHHIVDSFKAAGIPAAHVDGETPAHLRKQLIDSFRSGEIKYLSNVNLFGEGFDLPALDAVQMLRPTASLGFFLQMCGRPLRPDGDKVAIILDHVGNRERHGLPCQDRAWSLDGKAGRAKNGEKVAPIKVCEKCYGAQPSRLPICKYCGFTFEVKEREINEIDGELTKVDKEKAKQMARNEKSNTEGYENLVKLGHQRGYKNPEKWAKYVHESREAKKALNGKK